MSNENTVYSRSVLDFFTIANEYCIFIESAEQYTKDDILDYFAKVTPLLYIKGFLLPDVTVEYPEANERFVTEDQWQIIFNTLRNKFSNQDVFMDLSPIILEDKNAPQKKSLAENLADIYQDMKDFVLLFGKESQASRENAIHEARILFRTHWGHRLVDAHRYIHHILFENDIQQEVSDELD